MLSEPMYYVLVTLAERPRHGYDIIKRTAELSGDTVKLATGTLYPAIERLVHKGLVTETVHKDHDAPNRRYYDLSNAGRAALADEVAAHGRAVQAAAQPTAGMNPRLAGG